MDGEYWTFVAECTKTADVKPKQLPGACQDVLDPEVCLHCSFCDLTYAPDVMTVTLDQACINKLKEDD